MKLLPGARRDEKMIIQNRILSVHFNESGSLVSILDKRTRRTYLSHSIFSGLFRIFTPTEAWAGSHADSSYQMNPAFIAHGDSELEIRFDSLDFAPQMADFDFNLSHSGVTERNREKTHAENIRCVIYVKLVEEDIQMRMSVRNEGEMTVKSVIFPIVSGFGEESRDMDMVWPVQTQINKRVVSKPYLNLGRDSHKEWFHDRRFLQARYPLELVTAWVDFSDEKGGISFDIRSEDATIFDFCMEKVIRKNEKSEEQAIRGLFTGTQFYPVISPGGAWESPSCILRVHTADWHQTAKSHRNWLETVMKRPETPAGFRESLGWHFFLMKLQDGTEIRDFSQMEAMAQASLDAGIDNIMLFGLYDKGHDNDYDMAYLPNEAWGGPSRFVEEVRKLKQKGVRVIPFFNGTLMDSRLLENQPDLLKWCVQGSTGSRYGGQDWSRPVFDFPLTTYHGYTMTRNNMLYEVCITGKEGGKWFLDTVRRLSRTYETGNIQLDQLAHKSFVCYDPGHGHAAPEKAYTDGLTSLLKELKDDLRAYNPEGVVIGEGFSDLTASWCDGFWNWNQLENPAVVRYSVPWMRFSCEIDAMDYSEAAFCFAHGMLFDLKIEGGVGILSDFPAFQAYLKKLSDLKKRLRETYADGDFEDQDGIAVECEEGVVVKHFRNHTLNSGVVLVANTTADIRCASIEAQASAEDAIIIHWDGTEEAHAGQAAFILQPYEVHALEYKGRQLS